MKLASLPSTNTRNRNGDLIVVSKDLKKAVKVDSKIALSLLEALENWEETSPKLKEIYDQLNAGKAAGAFDLDLKKCQAPIRNAPGFLDGSAFLSHVVRARKARGDVMPESAKKTPLMYQGVSDNLLPAYGPIELMDESFGGDIEGEIAAVMMDTPKGANADLCTKKIALFTLFNDITFREIVKVELETKFGFLQSKPNSVFAPVMITLDELGSAWDGKRVNLDMQVELNNQKFGTPNGREMHFSMGEIIAHACRTRPLGAGTIVGTGTFSNESSEVGYACLTEKRFQEIIETGKPITPWLKPGDKVKIDMTMNGQSLFGPIEQSVKI